jgi:membrane-associated phospholipid phosphatase
MKKRMVFIMLIVFCFQYLNAQVDTTKTVNVDTTIIKKNDSIKVVKFTIQKVKNYYPFGSNRLYPFKGKNRVYSFDVDTIGKQTRLVPSLIVPLALIGYGLTTLRGNGIYSSYRAQKDVLRVFKGAQSHIDNYLIYTPYLELATLLLLKAGNRDDLLNITLLIVKSEILLSALTFSLKYIAKEERPYSHDLALQGVSLADRKKDKQAFVSMPSGHTSQAFCAATIVFREYRSKSIWYGVGAYTLATAVGLYRMINNQHWESDVLIGAGIGIFSANMAYAFHEHRWGKHAVVVAPAFDGNYKGFALSYNF